MNHRLFLLLASNFKKSSHLLFKKFLKKVNRSQSLIKQGSIAPLLFLVLAGFIYFIRKFLTQAEGIGAYEGIIQVLVLGLRVGQVLDDFRRYVERKRVRIARRSLKKFGRIAVDYLRMGWEAIAVCLTYRDLDEWERGKKSLSRYLNALRMYIQRRYKTKFLYCWVREMQERGVPHYHILLIVPKGVRIPKPDKSWWGHGHSNVKLLRFKTWRRIEWYLVDYLEKEIEVDEGGEEKLRYSHVFGVSQLVKTDVWWEEVDFHRYLKKLCNIRFGVKPLIDVAMVEGKLRVVAIQFKERYFKTYEEMKNYILDLIYGRVSEDDYYLQLADQLGW